MIVEFNKEIIAAAEIISRGGVIAYPTEAVYGLGCDPFNPEAIARLLHIKNRSADKGLILIAAEWKQVEYLIKPINPKLLARILATWPGPTTWIFPADEQVVPSWVRGKNTSIAIRVIDHPEASALCHAFNGPIISTSANLEGFPPIRDRRTLEMTFAENIDFILPGSVGNRINPSEIRDAISGEIIRPG
jgi:L-threonylcarbamoyladenylate synthase